VRDDPSNQPIVWGPEDEVYHDNALVYTMPGPPHLERVLHDFEESQSSPPRVTPVTEPGDNKKSPMKETK
jgi:hypothetical protein